MNALAPTPVHRAWYHRDSNQRKENNVGASPELNLAPTAKGMPDSQIYSPEMQFD